MKKNSLRFSALVLACVPLLLGTMTLVNAEGTKTSDTTETVSKSKTNTNNEIDAVKDEDAETTNSSKTNDATKNFQLKVKESQVSTSVGQSGKIVIDEKIGGKDATITGTFAIIKGKEPKSVDVFKDGQWTAKDIGIKENVNLMFTADDASKKLLESKYKDQDFSKAVSLKPIEFSVVEKIIDPIKTEAELTKLSVNGSKGKKGKLTIDHNGTPLSATFIDKKHDKIKLDTNGNFSVLETNKENSFVQEITFKLDDNDANFKKISESDEFKNKTIKLDYTQKTTFKIDSNIPKTNKTIEIPLINTEIKTNIGGTGILDISPEFKTVNKEGKEVIIKLKEQKDGKTVLKGSFTGKFSEKDAEKFITIDDKGNWKTLQGVQKGSTITPEFKFDESVVDEFNTLYPDNTIKLQIKSIPIEVDPGSNGNNGNGNGNNNGGKTAKDYVPVNKLPQTGEEKMRFGAVIGVVIIVIAGAIFFMKKKKNTDDTEE